jgi:cytochrome c biogenesis protein CcmG/thiol:disulfide interchange protein DsbE
MAKKNGRLTLIFTIIAAISLFTCTIGCSIPVGSQVGDNAPDFTLSTLDDSQVKLSELKGKPVMLIFWTTGCGACIYQMPFLEAAYNEMGDKVELITIDIQQNNYTVKSFMDNYNVSHNFSLSVALDSDGSVSEAYNVIYTPTNVVIDRSGVIQYIRKGSFTNTAEILAIFNDLE